MLTAGSPTPDERRLDAAIAALAPFFDAGRTWSGAYLEHFAYRALRENHPELTTAEAYVLVVAASRVYRMRERWKPRSPQAT